MLLLQLPRQTLHSADATSTSKPSELKKKKQTTTTTTKWRPLSLKALNLKKTSNSKHEYSSKPYQNKKQTFEQKQLPESLKEYCTQHQKKHEYVHAAIHYHSEMWGKTLNSRQKYWNTHTHTHTRFDKSRHRKIKRIPFTTSEVTWMWACSYSLLLWNAQVLTLLYYCLSHFNFYRLTGETISAATNKCHRMHHSSVTIIAVLPMGITELVNSSSTKAAKVLHSS